MSALLIQRLIMCGVISAYSMCGLSPAAADTITKVNAAVTTTYLAQIDGIRREIEAGSCSSAWDHLVSLAVDYPHEDRVYALIATVFAAQIFSYPRDSLFFAERGIVVPALLLASTSAARQDEPLTPDHARKALISILKVRTQKSETPLLDCLQSSRSARICADEAALNRRVATRDEMLSNMRLLNRFDFGVQCYGIRRETK